MGAPPPQPRKFNAADLFDTLEVALEGYEYTLRAATRSVSDKLFEQQEKAKELGEDSPPDDLADTLIEIIDILLEPKGDAPSTGDVLREKWEADALGLDWITAFSQSLQEEAQARRRPTSARKQRG